MRGGVKKENLCLIEPNQLGKISEFHQFTFKSDSIVARKVPGVGPGKVYKPKKVQNIASLEYEILQNEEGKLIRNHRDGDKFQMETRGHKKDESNEGRIWKCPTAWCAMPLMDFHKYEEHIQENACIRATDQEKELTAKGFVTNMYADRNGISNPIIRQGSARMSRSFKTNKMDIKDVSPTFLNVAKEDTKKGHALPPPKKIKRRTQEQKDFLKEIFIKGIDKRKDQQGRLSFETIHEMMMNAVDRDGKRKFLMKDWLTPKEIQSDLARMAAKRRFAKEVNWSEAEEEDHPEVEALIEDEMSTAQASNRADIQNDLMKEMGKPKTTDEHPLSFNDFNLCDFAREFRDRESHQDCLMALSKETRAGILSMLGLSDKYRGHKKNFAKKIVKFVEKNCKFDGCQDMDLFSIPDF